MKVNIKNLNYLYNAVHLFMVAIVVGLFAYHATHPIDMWVNLWQLGLVIGLMLSAAILRVLISIILELELKVSELSDFNKYYTGYLMKEHMQTIKKEDLFEPVSEQPSKA